jgi:hypothetical protein
LIAHFTIRGGRMRFCGSAVHNRSDWKMQQQATTGLVTTLQSTLQPALVVVERLFDAAIVLCTLAAATW